MYHYDERPYDYQLAVLETILNSIDLRLQQLVELMMDKQIRKIEKDNKKVGQELKNLEKLDKKRDPYCEAGEKMMKDKKKK